MNILLNGELCNEVETYISKFFENIIKQKKFVNINNPDLPMENAKKHACSAFFQAESKIPYVQMLHFYKNFFRFPNFL